MFGINACDIDTITVMGNAINDCICQWAVIEYSGFRAPAVR